jgi:uncharacterized protein (TIGR03435 family)
MAQIAASASLMVLLTVGAHGQDSTPSPTFEVASLKPNLTRVRGTVEFSKSGDRFTAIGMPLGPLILIAFNLTVRQVSGPDERFGWRYDIVAKAEHPVEAGEMLRMLQALLVERFQMAFHWETRDVPVYSLTVAKGGPKLHRSETPESDNPTPRIPSHAGGTESASGHLSFKDESMADFAWALSRVSGIGDRVVVDRTELPGTYDFDLVWERDPALGPPIVSALQAQLGLKLEPTRAPVQFLIVDRLERPSGN